MSIEKKFRKLTDIEHVLLRPGMYVGSVKPREEDAFLPNEAGSFSLQKISYNPAFLKIFDEIISNSVDEHRRNPNLNKIEVTVDQMTGMIKVWDNGGIPVVKHADHDEWVPELVFSNLKAGSNFNDEEDRLVAGTNGVGSTLTNIYSLKFLVRTCDGKHEFKQDFSENMTMRTDAEVTNKRKPGYTEITFYPDFKRFTLSGIDDTHLLMMKRRCIDLAACNPSLSISFNKEILKFESFKDYCLRYVQTDNFLYTSGPRWKLGLAPSSGSFQQVSFVNSVETRDGGTHVEDIVNRIVTWIRERMKKKFKLDLKPGEIRSHFFVFVQADIVNPAFSSQTKEKLITEGSAFGSRLELDETFLKKIFASEIIQKILDWAQQKAQAEERRQLRELNKNASKAKVLKLIDAKAKEGRTRCSLMIFEGDCLREDTQTLIFRESEGIINIPVKDIVVGDYVLSHNNTLRKVYAKTSKIARLFTINTKIGPIHASGEHKLYVYDVVLDEFKFIMVSDLIPSRYKLVSNKLSTVGKILPILDIARYPQDLLLETGEGFITCSPDHKFAVFNVLEVKFEMLRADLLDKNIHHLVFNLLT